MMKNRFLKLLLFLFALLLAFSSCKEEYEDTKDAGNNLLEANKNEAGVVVTASGLQYKVIYNNPYGIYPRLTGSLLINRTGYFLDGTVYEPSSIKWEAYSDLPNGMQEAVRKMRIGSKWRIWMPAELAYGADGVTNSGGGYAVDPNTVLVYDLEILEEN